MALVKRKNGIKREPDVKIRRAYITNDVRPSFYWLLLLFLFLVLFFFAFFEEQKQQNEYADADDHDDDPHD